MENILTKNQFNDKLKEIGFDRTKFNWLQYPKQNYDEITVCKVKMISDELGTRAVKDGVPETFLVQKC